MLKRIQDLCLSSFCFQVQAEVKKAWLRRSLTLDLKQKARMTSSGGGGSCYYGGMMSHTTTYSVSLSAANPRNPSFTSAGAGAGGSGIKLPRHSSSHPPNSLPGCTPSDTETINHKQEALVWKPGGTESGVVARHTRASKGNDEYKSHVVFLAHTRGAEEPESSSSVKELETNL